MIGYSRALILTGRALIGQISFFLVLSDLQQRGQEFRSISAGTRSATAFPPC
jgi:hypothetical protein